jgi:hypothetical protein
MHGQQNIKKKRRKKHNLFVLCLRMGEIEKSSQKRALILVWIRSEGFHLRVL